MTTEPHLHLSGTHFYRGGYDPDERVTVLGSTDDFSEFAERFAGYRGWVVIERADGSRMAASEGNLEAIQAEFNPLGGASRGVGRCICAAGPGTNPGCQVHP